YQVWLTIGLHYKVGRHGNGVIAQFLNGAGLGFWIDTYVLYIVAGALAGWHFDKLCAFIRRYLGTWPRVAAVAALGVAGGVGSYLIEVKVYGTTPSSASAVFSPVEIFEALVFGVALLGTGLVWSDRGAPCKKFAAAGSDNSFGIFLAHPLVLQVLLLVLGSHYFGAHGGLVGWLHGLHHSSIAVLIVLFTAVPFIYACGWVIASAGRRTPVSLFITGREWKLRRKTRLGQAADRALDAIEDKVTARATRVSRRAIVIALSVVVVACSASIAGARVEAARNRTMNTTTYSMQVGDMSRSYAVLTPAKTELSASAPIIMVLSGLNSTQDQEIGRDKLTPYAVAGDAELVYPLAYRESWNAIGCCSWAAKAVVNDTGFIKELVKKVDPGNSRPIYLMGYSNGARLAYTIACTDPLLFDGIAAVKGDPMHWCNITVPQKILQIASTDDTDVPYRTGEKGNFREMPAALVENTALKTADGCSTKSESSSQGNMTLTRWSDCLGDSSVTFAVYTAGVHSYPRPPGSYPAASEVIWAWIHDTVTVKPPLKKVP
ncbi:MAG: alpha/beta hydrolase family esterase, partial [Trebonia sp.]